MKKRRLLSILLTLCMVLALMPQMAFAEGDETSELQKLLDGGGTVTLEKDYTIYTTLTVRTDVILDLNGHVITMTGRGSVINVNSVGNLTLQDSDSTAKHDETSLPTGGVITNDYPGANGRGVYVYGSFTMNGGTIYKCHMGGGGGGVLVEYHCSFTMNGGAICDCSAIRGGGVEVIDSSFTMNGGAIYGCSAEDEGGGVEVIDSSFTMNGGTIYGCSAEAFSDAVSSNRVSNIYANGGTIKGTAVSYGKILNTATDGGCTRFYDEVKNATTSSSHGTISGGIYYGGISGGGTVEGTYHTVSFDLNGGSGSIPKQWFVNIDTAQALEPAVPTREGYKFAGWYLDEELKTPYDFESEVKDNITLYVGWEEEKITLTVPFTTTVEVSGNASPGETTFNLEVVDSQGNELSCDNVKITAESVTTNGAGSYDGKIAFTGKDYEILRMFADKEFVFVKQTEGDYPNWKVDDTVWCLSHSSAAELSEDEAEPSPIVISKATIEESENGIFYNINEDEGTFDNVSFTNKYNKQGENPAASEDTTGGDSDDNADKNAKTGDNVNLTLWITLMLLSVAGITGTAVYTRRKRTNE